jgi:hypothetical protein
MIKRSQYIAVLTILAAAALALASAPAGARRVARARAAHTLSGTETGHLHLVSTSGSLLFEEGPASGPLTGHMRSRLNLGAVFTGSFTIYTPAGSIAGRGSATPHGSGRYRSFSGALTVTGGTGRYAHAHGQAGLYGTFDQRTYALLIQTTGHFSY